MPSQVALCNRGTLHRSSPSRSTSRSLLASNLTSVEVSEQNSLMYQCIQGFVDEHRVDNTQKAYSGKQNEWEQFCEYKFEHEAAQSRYLVTSEKLYSFLLYHALRNKRRAGGKRVSHREVEAFKFDAEEYESIIAKHTQAVREKKPMKDPEYPVGFETVNTYKSAVRDIWAKQVAAKANSVSWDLIYDCRSKHLLNMVKDRKERIRQKNFGEKLDGQFAPFTTVDQVHNIEEWFWNKGMKKPSRSVLTSLRNRYTFLMCYNGVLRHETMFKGELSSLLALRIERAKNEDPMIVSILQLMAGKTVKPGTRQFGRAIRAREVVDCPIGALGFYLLHRFFMSGEFSDGERPDFSVNKNWFEIKILTDGSRKNTKSLKKNTYVDQIRQCFSDLDLATAHYGHWGRVSGAVKLEQEEVPPDLIKVMGNWEPSIQETRYSSKLPLMPLRVMAGFGKDEKHILPR